MTIGPELDEALSPAKYAYVLLMRFAKFISEVGGRMRLGSLAVGYRNTWLRED